MIESKSSKDGITCSRSVFPIGITENCQIYFKNYLTKGIRDAKGLRNRKVNILERESFKEMSDITKLLCIDVIMHRI